MTSMSFQVISWAYFLLTLVENKNNYCQNLYKKLFQLQEKMNMLLPQRNICMMSLLVCVQCKSCHSGQQGAVYRVQWWSKSCIFIETETVLTYTGDRVQCGWLRLLAAKLLICSIYSSPCSRLWRNTQISQKIKTMISFELQQFL